MGFWVARTKKRRGSSRVSPMTVTRRSCMASRRAVWVLDEARLISSAKTRLAKMGPGWKTKRRAPSISWRMGLPVMSPGSRSGVNWMRLASSPQAAARPLTSSVFPRPGRPSTRMCPEARMPVMTCSMSCCWPKRTLLRVSRKRPSREAAAWSSAGLGGARGVMRGEIGHEAGNKNQRKKAMSMRRCVLKPRYNFVLVFFD